MRCLPGILFLTLATQQATASEPPRRIASINLCTDQLLLDLARPGQIAAVGPYARDARLSYHAERAKAVPRLSTSAEELIEIAPDLVVSGQIGRATTRAILKDRGIRTVTFPVVRSLAEARAQILAFGDLAGAQQAAARRVEDIDAALERLRAAVARRGLRVLPLARRGWSAGQDSLLGDILSVAGFSHAAGKGGGGFLGIEQIVALRPDAILLSRDDDLAEDQGRALLMHPALINLFPRERRIFLPERLTVCGGAGLAEALDLLASQIGRIAPR